MSDFNKIKTEIKKGDFKPVYFLYGEESFFIDELVGILEKSVVEESARSFDQTILYGKETDVDRLVSAAKRFPMLASKQLVLVKEAQAMKGIIGLASYLANPAPTTVLVLAYKKKTIDKRTKFYKALQKHAVILESKRLYDNKIPAWIATYVKSKGLQLSPEVIPLLVEFLGTDIGAIQQQLDKLVLNLPKAAVIDAAIIEEYIGINREYNLFELQKALALGDRKKSYRIIGYFEQNPKAAPIPMMIGSLFNFFQKLYTYHHYSKKSDAELQKIMGLHNSYFVKEYRMAGRVFPVRKTARILGFLLQYDLRNKGVMDNNTPPGELMKEMVFQIFN